jgi:hypothetical protein
MSLGIVELDHLDTPKIVVVPSVLRITGTAGEGGLGNELVGLIEEAVMDIVSEKAIDQSRLRLVIMSKRGGALGRE